METALACGKAEPHIHVLLFGHYTWNARESKLEEEKDFMSFEERVGFEEGREWWKEERVELGERIERAGDWKQVVRWITDNRALI